MQAGEKSTGNRILSMKAIGTLNIMEDAARPIKESSAVEAAIKLVC
jgi:hypothetical protein